jgi:hypothetical protein
MYVQYHVKNLGWSRPELGYPNIWLLDIRALLPMLAMGTMGMGQGGDVGQLEMCRVRGKGRAGRVESFVCPMVWVSMSVLDTLAKYEVSVTNSTLYVVA